MRRTRILTLALAALAAWGCEHAGPVEAPPPDAKATFTRVQSEIFDTKCAVPSCHVSGTAAFGLVLSAGESYGNLVGVPSGWNPAVLRVKAGDSDSSFVFWKVTDDQRKDGERMPYGRDPLSSSEIALIRDWIDAGAKND